MKLLIFSLLISLASHAADVRVDKTTDEAQITRADVDFVQRIPQKDVDMKIFSYSGGDPAINGAYLNLAIFQDASSGYLVFPLGNVYNYKLMPSKKDGFLKFKIDQQTFNDNGDVITNKYFLYVNTTKALTEGFVSTSIVPIK